MYGGEAVALPAVALGRAGRAGVSKASTLTAFPDAMPWRRCAPCVGRCLMSACSGEHPSDPVSALIGEPGHRQTDGTHVGPGCGPPQCASTFAAWTIWSMLGSPVLQGGRQRLGSVRIWHRDIALSACKAINWHWSPLSCPHLQRGGGLEPGYLGVLRGILL